MFCSPPSAPGEHLGLLPVLPSISILVSIIQIFRLLAWIRPLFLAVCTSVHIHSSHLSSHPTVVQLVVSHRRLDVAYYCIYLGKACSVNVILPQPIDACACFVIAVLTFEVSFAVRLLRSLRARPSLDPARPLPVYTYASSRWTMC
ncbi:hypothetical protein GSI_12729 [Ganoderma sinense ZZ0214-1]|uniref:Uncharacterized protein n=1 Tax=Ganoderma sinense ZZ0214-1 TaxID=1077348 RepID=A0A2G8RTM1_9APHY|nr:hypothetical protein GSI_12729 [Ganoderma sinense ZZ0214-1]